MIVCSCNLIRENDIRAAARRGHRDADELYRSMGCEFECGGCRDHAEEVIAETLAEPESSAPRAA